VVGWLLFGWSVVVVVVVVFVVVFVVVVILQESFSLKRVNFTRTVQLHTKRIQ
jgi:uncharacterized membrane protein